MLLGKWYMEEGLLTTTKHFPQKAVAYAFWELCFFIEMIHPNRFLLRDNGSVTLDWIYATLNQSLQCVRNGLFHWAGPKA